MQRHILNITLKKRFSSKQSMLLIWLKNIFNSRPQKVGIRFPLKKQVNKNKIKNQKDYFYTVCDQFKSNSVCKILFIIFELSIE
jgi:hypothetical protein